MVQVVSPQFKTEKRFKTAVLLSLLVMLLGGILLFVLAADMKSQIQALKTSQTVSAADPSGQAEDIQDMQSRIERLIRQEEAATRRLEGGLTEFRSFRLQAEKDIDKLQKENKVMLLNNRDFIRMFEQIQNDLDETRLIMTPVSYKTEAEEQNQEVS